MSRPQLHFTPDKGWINDPNGMCFYDGDYHLCYQYYPDAPVWGPMHWGHARSRDLMRWEKLPVAISPTRDATIFSGSALIDADWHSPAPGSMVAMYTLHGEKSEAQGVSFCNDGVNYLSYAANPVIADIGAEKFRDPRLFRVPGEKTVRCAVSAGDRVLFYASHDFVEWEMTGAFRDDDGPFAGTWECPDLIALPDEGGEHIWALVVSRSPNLVTYYMGDFKDGAFVRDAGIPARLLCGRGDYYAQATFSPLPSGRVVAMAWLGDWRYAQRTPCDAWRGALSVPRELFVSSSDGMPALGQRFIPELMGRLSFATNASRIASLSECFILSAVCDGDFCAALSNETGEILRFGLQDNGLFIDRTRAGQSGFFEGFAETLTAARGHGGACTLYALYDHGILELIADEGTCALTALVFPESAYSALSVTESKSMYADF